MDDYYERLNQAFANWNGGESSLEDRVAALESEMLQKQDIISDLSEIRSGAAAGATAVQQTEFETDQARQETEIGVVANAGAKNLLNVTAQSTGIVTVNADGTLTVNGSSTSNTSVTLSNLWLKKGTYWLSSGVQLPTGVYLSIRIASGGQTLQVRDDVTELEFDVSSDTTIDRIWLFVNANTPVDNLTIYPMIRRAEITDDTFVPYAPTNRELYETCETKITMQQAYEEAIAIPANSNLNDYATPGLYYALIANVPTIANTPYTATGLRLVVEKNTTAGAAVFQTLYPTSRSHLEFYKRVYEGGSWSSWYKFECTVVS